MKTKKILIIEDEEDLVKGLKMNLADEGYEIDYSLNGNEGLTKALKSKPDLILLDVVMPDGMDDFRKIRQISLNEIEFILDLFCKGHIIPQVEDNNFLTHFDQLAADQRADETNTAGNQNR